MRPAFTLVELIVAVAILGSVMAIVSMALRTAARTAAAVDVRGDLNTTAWLTVRTIADNLRNAQVISVDTTNGTVTYKAITDLSGVAVLANATATTITRTTVSEGNRTYKRLDATTGTLTQPLAQEIAAAFIPIDAITLPAYGLMAASYPGFLIARSGDMVIIGVTVEQADPSGLRNANGTASVFHASAMTQILLRN